MSRFRTSRFKTLLAATATAAVLTSLLPVSADAAVCRSRISAKGQGQGILGAGTMNAKAAAVAAFEAEAAKRFGSRFGDSQKAQGIIFDCRSGTLKATCVVTGRPCR